MQSEANAAHTSGLNEAPGLPRTRLRQSRPPMPATPSRPSAGALGEAALPVFTKEQARRGDAKGTFLR